MHVSCLFKSIHFNIYVSIDHFFSGLTKSFEKTIEPIFFHGQLRFSLCNQNRTWNAMDFDAVMIKMILRMICWTMDQDISRLGFQSFFIVFSLVTIDPSINKCLFFKTIIDRKSLFFYLIWCCALFVFYSFQWTVFFCPVDGG